VVTTVERQKIRSELVANGVSWGYVDEWQPKTTLYRHAPGLNVDGAEVFPVGTSMRQVPGDPKHILKKSWLGMLPYPPGEACVCKWCSARNTHAEPVTETGEEFTGGESVACQECDEDVVALTKAGALSRLRVHMKTHQGTA
jgi:hypothetical protein